MIGKMKPTFVNQPDSKLLKSEHWLMYCASCKSIGNEYGQIYRFGLNHDLSLLGSLAADAAGITFNPSDIKPRQCFSKAEFSPESEKLMRYIAALHVFWIHTKIKDNAVDEPRWYWRGLNASTAPTFHKACNVLEELGVDIQWVKCQLRQQYELETRSSDSQYDIETYADITASVAGYFFRHSVIIAGASHKANEFEELGRTIGRALYITDAADDLEDDITKGCFNPFKDISELNLEQKKSSAKTMAIAAWRTVILTIKHTPVTDLSKLKVSSRIERIIDEIGGVSCKSSCHHSTSTSRFQKLVATFTATLMPTAILAQSNTGDDECTDTCVGCCCCTVLCGCGLATCASPSSSADCACDCCCGENPKDRWY